MKVLVTGKTGQVSTSLVERAARLTHVEIVQVGRPDFDLTNRNATISSIVEARPDIVISAAAYTAVDLAEDEPDIAYAVNVAGAGNVAEAALMLGVPVIHLSTDYVFPGTAPAAYTEDCRTGPSSVYGMTKREGERAVARINPHHVIVRTSWIYSPFGTNFLRTMLNLARNRDEIRVVSDQLGNPTSALDLADGLLTIAAGLRDGRYGIYHLTGGGETNWAGFARHIFSCSKAVGGPCAEVIDIASVDYPARAKRPANSRLSGTKVEAAFDLVRPDWRVSTQRVVQRVLAEAGNG